MNSHKKTFLITVTLFLFLVCSGKDNIVILGDSSNTHLLIDLKGGAIVSFKLTTYAHNPFSWNAFNTELPENNRSGFPYQGHFLCLGRWGAPTTGEMKAGVPHNGQAGNRSWDVDALVKDSLLVIRSVAPLDGIMAERKIAFDKLNAVFEVTERIQSTISIGRPFNIVQHVTIGPPFLSKSTIIDSNAKNGFMQYLSYPDPHVYEYNWPLAIKDSSRATIDLTRTDVAENYVSTHLFNDDFGWITASSPESEILIGYIWKTDEYPWLNLWHDMKDGKPWAKGLEFGTTGIGRSYQDLLAVDTRFHGENSFFYLDALETVEKSFICFQVKIPKDYKGVKEITTEEGKIILVEKGTGKPRKTVIKNLFSR